MGDMKLNCGEAVAKWFLVILNVIFLLLGLAFFIIGMVVRFSPDVILDNYLQPVFAQDTSGQIKTQVHNFDLTVFFGTIGIVIIIIGVVMLIVGFIGLFGACCQVRCMLIVYAVILIVLLLVQIGIIIAYFTQKQLINDTIRRSMRDIITNQYQGEKGNDAYSAILNYLFVEGKCCGIDSYADMTMATKWKRQHVVNGQSYTQVHPVTCCKITGTFPNYQQPADLTCSVTPTVTNSNFNQGCLSVINEFIASNVNTPLIVLFVILMIVEIAAVVFAFLLCCAIGRDSW